MDLWSILWLAWGALFAVIETVAIIRDTRDGDPRDWRTLSDHLRKWWRTDTKRGRTAWLVVSGVFFAWFTTHIAVDGSI